MLLAPLPGELEKLKSCLPQFKPHDLRKLAGEIDARVAEPAARDAELVKILRRENEKQVDQLLRSMRVDRRSANGWERAFFWLAYLHHGLGHLAWRSRRTNQNAAKWSREHDLKLIIEVTRLTQQGYMVRASIRRLARDRKKKNFFPYNSQTKSQGSSKQIEDALRARWLTIGKRETTIEDAILGTFKSPRGSIEWALALLDESLAKNKLFSKSDFRN
jgi:hypothetical protein